MSSAQPGPGRVVASWAGVAVGVVLLVRLAAQAVRAIGYGAAWLDDVVLSELVTGWRFSLADVVIIVVVLAVGAASLAWRGQSDASGNPEGDG